MIAAKKKISAKLNRKLEGVTELSEHSVTKVEQSFEDELDQSCYVNPPPRTAKTANTDKCRTSIIHMNEVMAKKK